MLVGEALRRDAAVLAGDGPKHRPVRDPAESHPGLEHRDGAGEGGGAAADLDLAPAGLAVDGQQQAAVAAGADGSAVFSDRVNCRLFSTEPKISIQPVPSSVWLGAAIEADDFRAAQPAGEADGKDGLVAQAAQVVVQRRQHGQQLVGEDRLLLGGRAAMGAADAGQHGGDMGVARVERAPELAVAPADP